MLSLFREGVEAQRACLVLAPGAFISQKKKYYASSKKLLTSIKKKGPLGNKPLHQKRKGGSVRIRRVAGRQASRPLLIGLKVGRMLKRTSGLNKLMSIVHRMSMEFESKFLDSL